MLLPCYENFPIDKSEKISDTGQRRNTAKSADNLGPHLPMSKLLKAYAANPTLANAHKVITYGKKHPMSYCMLTRDEDRIAADAARHIGEINNAS